MKRSENKAGRDGRLEKKLAAYALAGAAALVPGAAKAGTINVFSVGQSIPQTGAYVIGLPVGDITISTGPYGAGGYQVQAAPGSNTFIAESSSFPFNAAALAFGSLIDPSTGSWGSGGKTMASYDPTAPYPGEWSTNGGNAYLGFYFQASDGNHAGWADISTFAAASGAAYEVNSYAYRDDANLPINAGQTSDVPEPSTMALIALGGAGVVALRRRRAANA